VDGAEPEVLVKVAETDDAVMIAFGGLYMRVGIADYEFFDVTSDLPVGLIFVRDRSRRVYQGGLEELGSTFPAMAATLRELAGGRRVVTVGNSGGGFAALVFGALIGAAEVHAFSPVTFIGRWRRALHKDHRFSADIDRVNRGPHVQRQFMDARRWMRRAVQPTQFHLYYAKNYDLDRLHAERVRRVRGVALHPRDGKGHNTIRDLAVSGELKEILRDAVNSGQRADGRSE
jgi:pimeloyl-ACP methyl ester carboxylesterase